MQPVRPNSAVMDARQFVCAGQDERVSQDVDIKAMQLVVVCIHAGSLGHLLLFRCTPWGGFPPLLAHCVAWAITQAKFSLCS